MGKYFLAIVPDGVIQEKAQDLKERIREEFNIKYALRSPAHITLKMPFNYNEKKEDRLLEFLAGFSSGVAPFELLIEGVDCFGRRVIFWDVKKIDLLLEFQAKLVLFCRREIKLNEELADKNYHPHMTIAFKDLKTSKFDEIHELVLNNRISKPWEVKEFSLLKRVEDKWLEISRVPLQANP